ncbi:MAG TPA: CBS domain-containing protein [Polyangia bacterium]|jgi:CBS domain-containing protein|nr:CBS domain-containing protein [Polyangia bacterium]
MFDFDVLKISEAPEAEADSAVVSTEILPQRPIAINGLRLDVRVTDIPRGPAVTLSPEAGVATAIAAMRQRARGAAVVVQNHRPVGVVTDREILTRACADVDDLRAIPIGSVMLPCAEPLRESDTVGSALRRMCEQRSWHLPIVCNRGLFLGALDIADISFWLRDRLTLISVDAALAGVEASV